MNSECLFTNNVNLSFQNELTNYLKYESSIGLYTLVKFTNFSRTVCVCVCVCVCVFSCSVTTDSLQLHGHSSPGSSVHGIFQTRTLEQVAISYSRGYS